MLLVINDARVRYALSELVNSTPGLITSAAVATATEAEDSRATTRPAVALVDVRPTGLDTRLTLIRSLSQDIPVVAMSPISSLAEPATAAGAVAFCETDGNNDALITALRNQLARSSY